MNKENTNTATDRYKSIEHHEEKPLRLSKKAVLALGAVALSAGMFTGNVVHSSEPHYSPENVSYVLDGGDTLWNAVNSIPGSRKLDKRDIIAEIKARNPNIDFSKPLPAGIEINLPANIS